MNPRKSRKILNILAFTAMGIVFLSRIPFFHSIRKEMIFAAIIIISCDAIFGFLFLRCPHCKKLLNLKWSSQSICYHCGEKLENEHSKSQTRKL